MNILIFAGGAGTRLWPLSRRATPKQFEKFFDGKSTLQMAIERVACFGFENIFISTNVDYVDIVKEQVPDIDDSHIFSEPCRRDLGAAVGLSLARLKKMGVSGTVGMVWSDHLMDNVDEFVNALKLGEKLIGENSERFVFMGEKARYAEANLGWINVDDVILENGVVGFKGWKYRPEKRECELMFESGGWLWNPGYFVYDIDFVVGLYEKYQGEMYRRLVEMVDSGEISCDLYGELEAISFDNAIVEKVGCDQAVVIPVDMGWSDPGTLYAMKEAMVSCEADNVEKGRVVTHLTRDCFVYNEEDEKLVTTVGLDGVVVVNTCDGLLVCAKDSVPEIKKLLRKIEDEGFEKYL